MMQLLRLPDEINRQQPVRQEASRVLTLLPHISATALFMKTEVHEVGQPEQVAATNGQKVIFWPAFWQCFQEKERQGILLHEYLHAALAHPQRGALLGRRHADFNDKIFGVAADAIVNQAIYAYRLYGKSEGLILPENAIKLSWLKESAKEIVNVTKRTDIAIDRLNKPETLTVELLYHILVQLNDAAKDYLESQSSPEDGAGENSINSNQGDNGAPGEQPSCRSQQRPATDKIQNFVDQMKSQSDLMQEKLSGLSTSDLQEEIRQAGNRLKNADAMLHGTNTNNIFEKISGDIPEVQTPWEAVFRSLTQRYLSRDRAKSPLRPGRRVLSQEALELKDIIWSPARRRRPVPLALAIMDSSGSINAEEYKRYLGEIQAMLKRTNARLYVAVADVKVHSLQEIAHVKDIPRIEFQGRGGTDFREAIALGESMNADVIIYLTDLMGTFPQDKPKAPVIWAVPNAHGTPPNVPFGKVITLN